METDPNQITFFAKTNFRNREVPFGIKGDDRRRHMYVIGKTGMGKTTLMENMAIQDIRNGQGVCFMDPHGDSVVKILDFIPNDRVNDVIYFNPADLEFPIAFNIMESVEGRFKHLVASGLMGVFTKIWANLWSARMEYILGNTVRALLDSPGNSMLGITRMYIDKQYRKRIVDNIKDPMVRIFWTDEYANYDQKYVKEAIAPIQNKVGQFLSSAIIRNIVGQPKSTIDLRDIMDNRKILLMDLSKGKVGEENAALLGAMIITKLQLAAMSRVDMEEAKRPDFYLYVDEFQNFATESFATILSEARKYHLNLVMGHQYIGQLTPTKDNTRLRDAIFGNVGTMICFRVGAADAEYLETEFAPVYTPGDLVNLPKYHILLKLMINGVASEPFSARSIPVNPDFRTGNSEKVIRVSRERYGNPIEAVEERISRWMGAEFHQQSAVLAAPSADEAAALPTASFPQLGDVPRQAPVPRDASQKGQKQLSEMPLTNESEAARVIGEDVSAEQKQVGYQNMDRAPETRTEPLVFKMPEVPKPTPREPTPQQHQKQNQALGRQGRDSERSQTRHLARGGSSGDNNRQAAFRGGAAKDTRGGSKHKNGKQHQNSRGTSVGGAAKPNIWDTVATLHEERAEQIAERVTSAMKDGRGTREENAPAPNPASSTPLPSPHGTVVKPGEVHTF